MQKSQGITSSHKRRVPRSTYQNGQKKSELKKKIFIESKEMDFSQFISDINKKAANFRTLTDRTLPVKAGNVAVEHFRDNFRQGGFVDGGLQKWKPSKRLSSGSKSAAGNRPTLMSERDLLFSDIKKTTRNGEVIIHTTETTQDYAAVHNEGLRSGRGRGFQMPKRQFIGDSKELNDKIENLIESELSKI